MAKLFWILMQQKLMEEVLVQTGTMCTCSSSQITTPPEYQCSVFTGRMSFMLPHNNVKVWYGIVEFNVPQDTV